MESDVTRSIEEQLSAFLDGELPEAELQLLIRRLEKDEVYRATLARYSLVGSILRDEAEFSFGNGIRAGVMARISAGEFDGSRTESNFDTVADTSAHRPPGAPLLSRRTGSMLAAAVAALAVVGIYQLDMPEAGLSEERAVASVSETIEAAPAVERSTNRPLDRPINRTARTRVNADRMTSYMVSHGEFSRSLQGTMVDSRVFVQQASYQE